MNTKIIVYKVVSGESWCAWADIESTMAFLKKEIEAEIDGLEPGKKTRDYHIEICEMNEDEYINLPEFINF